MTGVSLRLDERRWREHLATVQAETPGLVPVIKGNGYGFGRQRLAEEATTLGIDTIAVGVPSEVRLVREVFGGDVVILNPFALGSHQAIELLSDQRVITTVSRLSDLVRIAELDPRPRVVVEIGTSMLRHGLAVDQLGAAAELLDGVDFQGWSVHLPLLAEGRYAEATRLVTAALAARPGPIWISHLPADEVAGLARELGDPTGDPLVMRQRVGTRLWLGAPSTRETTATVLDVHRIERGQRVGYRQRKSPADGWIVVVAGGTSHGIGLEAPTSASTLRQRAVALASGSLEAAGLALSPYTIAGKKRWFYEPPHMQSSLVFLPKSERPPALGDEVPVELRLTTATVDQITAA